MALQIVSSAVGGLILAGVCHFAWQYIPTTVVVGAIGVGIRSGGVFGFFTGLGMSWVVSFILGKGLYRNEVVAFIMRMFFGVIIGAGLGVYAERSLIGWWL